MDTTALLQRLTASIDAGHDAAAIEALTALLAQDPQNADAHWQAGRFFGHKGALTEAAERFRFAVGIDPRLSHVEFVFQGHRITLRDIEGSTMPALVLDEVGRGMYDLVNRQFAHGDVILDIGAHIGTVSILLAKCHPEARIVAYEPSASNFAMLCENLRANGVHNVTPVQEGIAGVRETRELMWLPTLSAGATAGVSASMREALAAEGWQRETITCVTLEDIFARHGITHCAFMKLDCEGAEWEVYRASTALDAVDAVAMELHLPASRQAEGADALRQEFAALVRDRAKAPVTVLSSTVWSNLR